MDAQSACMNNLSNTPIADAFSAGLPLPSTLDPRFEEALRHVLDHPGSLIRPRMVLLVASAYGLDAGAARDLVQQPPHELLGVGLRHGLSIFDLDRASGIISALPGNMNAVALPNQFGQSQYILGSEKIRV